jgi:hypothetical protein
MSSDTQLLREILAHLRRIEEHFGISSPEELEVFGGTSPGQEPPRRIFSEHPTVRTSQFEESRYVDRTPAVEPAVPASPYPEKSKPLGTTPRPQPLKQPPPRKGDPAGPGNER